MAQYHQSTTPSLTNSDNNSNVNNIHNFNIASPLHTDEYTTIISNTARSVPTRDELFEGNDNNNNSSTTSSNESIYRIVIGLMLLVFVSLVIFDTLHERRFETIILNFLSWVEENPFAGVIAVIIVYIIATILFVPGSLLTLGTGFAFGSACNNIYIGVLLASTAVFIGASLGSIFTFLLGRYLFRSCVLRLTSTYPVFQAIDRALQGNGLKIMVLLRLSPLIPYNALDYMSGVTAISLWSYALSMFGMLPGIILFCYVGASASSLTDTTEASDNQTVRIVTIVAGIIFALIGVTVAGYYSKKELDRILQENERVEYANVESTISPLHVSQTESFRDGAV